MQSVKFDGQSLPRMAYTSGEFEIIKSPVAFAKRRRRHFDNHMNNRVKPPSQSYHSALARCRPALRDEMALLGKIVCLRLLHDAFQRITQRGKLVPTCEAVHI